MRLARFKPDKADPEKMTTVVNGKLSGGEDGGDEDAGKGPPPHMFCQMDVLYHFIDGDMEWRESARWVKFEERVEVGQRWSKPYVATLSLHALFEMRSCVSDGVVILDTEQTDLTNIYSEVVDEIVKTRNLSLESRQKMMFILTRPHKHQHRKGLNKAPFQGKLAFWNNDMNSSDQSLDVAGLDNPPTPDKLPDKTLQTRFPFPELPSDGTIPQTQKKKFKPNKKFKKKIPKGAEAANILVGEVDFLTHPVMAFIRLQDAFVLGHVTEVPIPTKFMFVLLGPPEHHSIWEYEEVGRAAANLLSDQLFCAVAHAATDREALLSGIDEYIDDLTVLPPSIWDPSTRLEPPNQTADANTTLRARRRLASRERHVTLPHVMEIEEEEEEDAGEDTTLTRTGRFFGGMVQDIKRRYPLFLSDITDAISLQSLASIVFLYFACITPIVTFGGLLGDATKHYMGTMETILSGAICGIAYHLFAGQPLTIVGATGPLLIFESLVFKICSQYGFDFLAFRFWIGMWCTLLLLLIVAFDLSALVRYITRFTEESFAVLISLIFIYEAFSKQIHTLDKNPIHTGIIHEVNRSCHCLPQSCPVNASDTCLGPFTSWVSAIPNDCITINQEVIVNHMCITEEECGLLGGNLTGNACYEHRITHGVPDVFLFSTFLFFGTFVIAWTLARFRNSSFFPSIIRTTMADFAVVIGVVIMTGIDFWVALPTPKLPVPSEVKTTIPDRGWVVNPMILSAWWLPLLALVPALLATILIFLDQQITAVIVNRKEHKLKKGHGYHLDLFMVAVLIAVCSVLGLPWFVAATVRTITHVRSLMRQSESAAPGEKPIFLGVREQRLTGLIIHILIGVSVLLTVILQKIPMSVLYGVFLYMGISSLRGVQFVQRILLMFMPQKYQPDYIYLRHVQTSRVHIFTIIQILCMAAMWAVKMTTAIAIAFPLVILGLCAVRKLMSFLFSKYELEWLDDLSPEELRRHREDMEKQHGEKGEHLTEDDLDLPPEEFGKDMERRPSVRSSLRRTNTSVPSASIHHRPSKVDLLSPASWHDFQDLSPVKIPKIASMKELQREMHESCEPIPITVDKQDQRGEPNGGSRVAIFQPLGTGSGVEIEDETKLHPSSASLSSGKDVRGHAGGEKQPPARMGTPTVVFQLGTEEAAEHQEVTQSTKF